MGKVKVPTLETERLILRMWSKKDAPQLFAYAKNPNVGPDAGWKPHSSVAESRSIIAGTFLVNMCWAIVEKESGTVIGSIGLNNDRFRPDVKSKELGYSLSEEYWGRGIMTEVAERVIKYSFEVLKLDVLMINTGVDNVRSRRVIEKCRFVYEGTLRKCYRAYDGTVRAVRCYSMMKKEYFQRKAEREGQKGIQYGKKEKQADT